MKQFFSLSLLAFIGWSNILNAQNFQWAKSMGGTSGDIGRSIALDASGNVYTTGTFQGTADFDPGAGTFNLTSAGNRDIFISKLGQITGISENEIENTVSIYPNPFSTQTTLQTDNLLKNATLTVYNFFGQTVAQIKNINGQTVTFSRDNLASGLYFVHLTQDSKVIASDKLIITD